MWIAGGFIGAFAASVLTVIYTGLMVEGRPSEFDAGFQSVTLHPGETGLVPVIFEVRVAVSDVRLELTLPAMLEEATDPHATQAGSLLSLNPGKNEVAIAVRAVGAGNGYLIARVLGDEPVALERVFVTVTPD